MYGGSAKEGCTTQKKGKDGFLHHRWGSLAAIRPDRDYRHTAGVSSEEQPLWGEHFRNVCDFFSVPSDSGFYTRLGVTRVLHYVTA